MSTNLRISKHQFPNAFAKDAKVGDEVELTVRGTIRRIEAELIDISSMDQEHAATGHLETEVLVHDMTHKAPA